MIGNERTRAVIDGSKADRMPMFGWVQANLDDQISSQFGSVASFEDHYEFDLAHLFGGPSGYDTNELDALREAKGGTIEPADLLELTLLDPTDSAEYESLRQDILHHKEERGRFVYVQTPGVFEAHNGYFGIENHLMYLLLFPDDLQKVYARQAVWTASFAECCLNLGIDMIHVSDDWGSQRGLLFSPELFRNIIVPHHLPVSRLVKKMGGYFSIHSDGNINSALDTILDLGFDVVHPWQESAGMSYDLFDSNYRNKFTVMGGIDVQTSIGFGEPERAKREVGALIDRFHTGGMILCTTHFVQDHCSMDELTQVFDFIYEKIRN